MSWDGAVISFKEHFSLYAYQLVVHLVATAKPVGYYLCKYIPIVILDSN
jgi:hypothetical protein